MINGYLTLYKVERYENVSNSKIFAFRIYWQHSLHDELEVIPMSEDTPL
ncbi:MAG: hypothetical protein QW416_08275 [Candidatus Nitrosocaldaceae archaeon]